jgi:hypothetical protein
VYIYPIQINWWRKFIFIVKLVVDKKSAPRLEEKRKQKKKKKKKVGVL